MNKELIHQLAEKAAGTRKHVPPVWQFYDQELEAFVRLIVRECVTICNSVQEQYGQYTFTATTVKNRIQEHFGVAE